MRARLHSLVVVVLGALGCLADPSVPDDVGTRTVCTTTEDCPPELFCPAFAGDLQAHCRSPRIPGCANGVVDEGEACDDANFLPHDGCSPDCLDE